MAPPGSLEQVQYMLLLQYQVTALVCGILYLLRLESVSDDKYGAQKILGATLYPPPSVLGQISQLKVELQREAKGNIVAFLWMEPDMFHEILVQLTPHL